MTKMCNLPRYLAVEVLSRVPMTSLRRVRSTCRKWNTLSKDMSFAKKHLAQARLAATEGKEITVVVVMDFRVRLMSVNLQNNVDESCIKPEAKLIGPDGSDEVHVCQVFHCEGLLLCFTRDNTSNTRLVVWNPYWGQTTWIKPTYSFYGLDAYALGYEKSSNSCRRMHKILRSVGVHCHVFSSCYRIYDLDSESWRDLDVTPEWMIDHCDRGISLKGNTYWLAKDMVSGVQEPCLLCFDFTRERFGPRLPLPPRYVRHPAESLCLSSVREEQLAVLFQRGDTLEMEIWFTTKIEPNAVLWRNKVFLSANIKQLIDPLRQFASTVASFFIDEEEKVAVAFDKTNISLMNRRIAYIVGVDGSLKKVDLVEFPYKRYDSGVALTFQV